MPTIRLSKGNSETLHIRDEFGQVVAQLYFTGRENPVLHFTVPEKVTVEVSTFGNTHNMEMNIYRSTPTLFLKPRKSR